MANMIMKLQLRFAKRMRSFATPDFRRLLKNTSWTTALSILSSGIYLVEIMILARYLPPDILGAFFLLVGFPDLVQTILDVQVKDMMTRYLSMFVKAGNIRHAVALIKVSWLIDVSIASAALVIVAIGAQWYASSFVNNPSYAYLIILYSCGMFFESLDSASGSILRVFDRFDIAFWGGLTWWVSRLIFILFVVSTDLGIAGVVWSRVLGAAVSTIMLGGLSLRLVWTKLDLRTTYRTPIRELREYRREMTSFILHVNVASTLKALFTKLDVILIGGMLGPAMLAVYKLSTQFAKTLSIISDPLAVAMFPQFASLYAQGKVHTIDQLAKRSSVLIAMLGLPLLCIFYFLREPIVTLFGGAAYRDYSVVFLLALIVMGFTTIFSWVRPYLLSVGLMRALVVGTVVGSIGGLLLQAGLTYMFGIIGAVLGFGAPYVLAVSTNLCQIILWRQRIALTGLPQGRSP